MGNCQAIDAATLVVQHPNGKVDKFYWAMSASEIMRMNPGHYVALLISTTLYHHNSNNNKDNNNNNNNNNVRLTRIKLLRPTDTLVLGQVYRLITSQEVMKGLLAKKHAKLKKNHPDSADKPYDKAALRPEAVPPPRSEPDYNQIKQVSKHERQRARSTSSSNSTARSKTWQPSLQSISEAAS
ncbi:hypothetical protein CCACVL1_12350 [Corchorus capsularis]|uniref:DUF4228 domain-containing protein n=1 Tax=Corchorus capsularis TaxID=210143 RepID=A0A1R3IG69_COCAP|nr:hypothetical protein CCACVL1_12350 [Corchorus capsularis]